MSEELRSLYTVYATLLSTALLPRITATTSGENSVNRRNFLSSIRLAAAAAAFRCTSLAAPQPTRVTVREDQHKDIPSFVIESDILRAEFVVQGIRLPYRLTRRVTFPAPDRVRMEFQVENSSPFVMPYLWSAHPMLQPEEGSRILLPAGSQEATVGLSHSGRLGRYGDHISWP